MAIPYEEGGERRRKACESLVLLLKSLCLRRTKVLLDLPGCESEVVPITLTEQERKWYESTKNIMDRSMRQSLRPYEHKNRFGLFQALLQSRIFCNHGTFQRHFSWNTMSQRDTREPAMSALGQNCEIRCSGCKLPMPVLGSNRIGNVFVEDCAHVFCSECLEDSTGTVDEFGQRHCHICMLTGATRKVAQPKGTEQEDDLYFDWTHGYSSKMEALVRDLRECLFSTKRSVFF